MNRKRHLFRIVTPDIPDLVVSARLGPHESDDSPETMRQNFACLTLEQVYGTIVFYLGHEPEVDAHIREGAPADELLAASIKNPQWLSGTMELRCVNSARCPESKDYKLTRHTL